MAVDSGLEAAEFDLSVTPLRALPLWVNTTRTFDAETFLNATSFHCPPAGRSGVSLGSATSRQRAPSQYRTATTSGACTPPPSS